MISLENKRKWIALLFVLSFIFVSLLVKLKFLPLRILETEVMMMPVDTSGLHTCKSFGYRFLWNQTVNKNYSFDSKLCGTVTREKQFWINFKLMMQEKNFRNITCQPRIANASKTPLILTALASYPGSGNTWSRHLIEQLTGIQTSSVYCDGSLRGALKGECMKDKRLAICTKTHFLPDKDKHAYRKAVLIIRNPFDAVLAYFKFTKKGHTGDVYESMLKGKGWYDFSRTKTGQWKDFNLKWLKNFNYSISPLLFENLLHQNTFFEELFKLSQFFNTKITYGQLWCIWKNREGRFHRKPTKKRPPEAIQLYSQDVQKRVFEAIAEVDTTFLAKFGHHLPFAHYT